MTEPDQPFSPRDDAEGVADAEQIDPQSPLGLVAFVVGLASVLVSLALTLGQGALVATRDPDVISTFSILHNGLDALVGLGTLVLGIVALVSRGTSKPLAAAATTIGAMILVGVLANLLYLLVVTLSFG